MLDLAKSLRSCDVVLGCTDDNRGRAVLSRLAYWYLLPVFGTAFLVDTDGKHVRGYTAASPPSFPEPLVSFAGGALTIHS